MYIFGAGGIMPNCSSCRKQTRTPKDAELSKETEPIVVAARRLLFIEDTLGASLPAIALRTGYYF